MVVKMQELLEIFNESNTNAKNQLSFTQFFFRHKDVFIVKIKKKLNIHDDDNNSADNANIDVKYFH